MLTKNITICLRLRKIRPARPDYLSRGTCGAGFGAGPVAYDTISQPDRMGGPVVDPIG